MTTASETFTVASAELKQTALDPLPVQSVLSNFSFCEVERVQCETQNDVTSTENTTFADGVQHKTSTPCNLQATHTHTHTHTHKVVIRQKAASVLLALYSEGSSDAPSPASLGTDATFHVESLFSHVLFIRPTSPVKFTFCLFIQFGNRLPATCPICRIFCQQSLHFPK